MKPNDQITRRQILAAGATAAAITIVPRHVLGGPGNLPPSERVNVAGIGAGGQGGNDLERNVQEIPEPIGTHSRRRDAW